MREHPWFKFYASRWLGDPHLRLVGAMARGILIDMMAIAHDGEPYGYVTNGGIPLSDEEIASYCKERVDYTRAKLVLLRNSGRIATDAKGVYYIPSMVRQAEQHEKHVRHGLKGGNPDLLKGVNLPLNLEVNPKVKVEEDKKEIESQKKKRKSFAYSEEFENFWKILPKGSKKKAFDEFQILPHDAPSVHDLTEILLIQKKDKEERDGFGENPPPFKDLERWLRDRRWEDEIRKDGGSV